MSSHDSEVELPDTDQPGRHVRAPGYNGRDRRLLQRLSIDLPLQVPGTSFEEKTLVCNDWSFSGFSLPVGAGELELGADQNAGKAPLVRVEICSEASGTAPEDAWIEAQLVRQTDNVSAFQIVEAAPSALRAMSWLIARHDDDYQPH